MRPRTTARSRVGRAVLLVAALLPAAGPARADEAPENLFETPTMEWNLTAEVGYWGVDIEGSEPLYRSHVNYDGGLGLFDFSLTGTPKGASTARLLDTLELSASGLGGSPQEWARLSMAKRGAYRWDVRFDQSDYFFDVPDFVRFGQRFNDFDRRNLETTLEMTPGPTRVYVSLASRDYDGPAYATQDLGRDEFGVFTPVDRNADDARAGIDFKVGRWNLGLEQAYRKIESRATIALDPNETVGNNPTGGSSLTSFFREVPLEGTYWISRASASTTFADRVDLSIRLVRSDGETEGTSAQDAAGNYYTTGNPLFTESINTRFESELPSSLAEVGVSIRLTDSVFLHNNLRYHDYEIEGRTDEAIDRDVTGSPIVSTEETFERLTDWTSWEARTEAEWRLGHRWTLHGGYRRLDRDVSFEASTDGTVDDEVEADQAADTFYGKVAYKYERRWSAFLEYYDGEVDNVFLRVNPADYELVRLHAKWHPTDRWSINASGSYRHGENPTPDFGNTVYARSYGISADYAGKALTFTAGYNGANVESTTDISYCTASSCSAAMGTLATDVSLWEFADHHFFADGVYQIGSRFRVSLNGNVTDSRETFPVDFYHVEPSVSVRLTSGFWANAGWYRYRFDRNGDSSQDYTAEGGFFSIRGEF